jgi:sugar fermentation stimulation protein A
MCINKAYLCISLYVGDDKLLITNNIRHARFIRRPNRFQAYVELDGEELMVHVPNTGRNKEILVPGYTVVLREESNPLRKTKYESNNPSVPTWNK